MDLLEKERNPVLKNDTWTQDKVGVEGPQTTQLLPMLKPKTHQKKKQNLELNKSECHSQTREEAIRSWYT